MQIM
jgi:hypothetical protein